MEFYFETDLSDEVNNTLSLSDFAKDSHVRLWTKAKNTINPVLEKGTLKTIDWNTGKITIYSDIYDSTTSVDLKKTHSFNDKPFDFDDFVKNQLEGIFIPSIVREHITLPKEIMEKASALDVGISSNKKLIVTGTKNFIEEFNTFSTFHNDFKVLVSKSSNTDDALHTLICEHAQLAPQTEIIVQSLIMHSADTPLENNDEDSDANEATVEQHEVHIVAEETEVEDSAEEKIPYGSSKPYNSDIHIYHPLKGHEINRRKITIRGNAPANKQIYICPLVLKTIPRKLVYRPLTKADGKGAWEASYTMENGDHNIAVMFLKGKTIVSTWGHNFKVVSLWLKYYPNERSEAGHRIVEYQYSAFEPPKNDTDAWIEVRGHIPLHLRSILYYQPFEGYLTTTRMHGTLSISRYKRQAKQEIPSHANYTEADYQKINDKINTTSEMNFVGTLYSSFNWAKAAYVACEALKNPFGTFATLISMPFASNRESVNTAYNIGSSVGFILQTLLARIPVAGAVATGLSMGAAVIQNIVKVTYTGTISHDDLIEIGSLMKNYIDLQQISKPGHGNLINENKLIENTTIDSRGSRDFIITSKRLTPLYGSFSHEERFVADEFETKGIVYQRGGYYRNLSTGKDYIHVDGRWVRIGGFKENGSPLPVDKNGTAVTNTPRDIVKGNDGNWTTLRLRGGVGERTIPLYNDVPRRYDPQPQLTFDPNYLGQGDLISLARIPFENSVYSGLPVAIGADARPSSAPQWMGNIREPGILLFETQRFRTQSPRDNEIHEFINITPTSSERASDNTNLIRAYWVPQHKYYDIPIHPTGTEPTILLTDNFSGCSFVVDQMNDTHYRVYHVFSSKEDVLYNNLPDHGRGQVAYIPHTEYEFLHRATADSLHPSLDACGFISMQYNNIQAAWVISVRSQSLPVQITSSGRSALFNGTPPRLNKLTPIIVSPIND